jgi:hypothetical protein
MEQSEVLTDSGQTVEVSVDIVTQNQQIVHCEVLTDSGQTAEVRVDIVTQNQQTVHC